MKNYKILLCLLLVFTLLFPLLTGCGKSADDAAFFPSDSMDENGFWKDIKALDCVEMFGYKAMSIPNDIHQISDEELQVEVDNLLAGYSTSERVTDRAVADGDMVNIDYVGSVDGVEFSGGSTEGMGTDVTAGSPDYIDDFLTQIIGHMPGETINVEVTFPEDYNESSLQGKDAVFVTTINYIAGSTVLPELTDEFVETNLFAAYGWKTIAEMQEGKRIMLQKNAIEEYVGSYLATGVVVRSMPDKLTDYQEKSMLSYYQKNADDYGVELDEFLESYVGVSNKKELIESSREDNIKNATFSLVIQAIAEDAGISVGEEDLVNYFTKYLETSDYSSYEEQYGLPYLKQVVLGQKVIDYIVENAVLS